MRDFVLGKDIGFDRRLETCYGDETNQFVIEFVVGKEG